MPARRRAKRANGRCRAASRSGVDKQQRQQSATTAAATTPTGSLEASEHRPARKLPCRNSTAHGSTAPPDPAPLGILLRELAHHLQAAQLRGHLGGCKEGGPSRQHRGWGGRGEPPTTPATQTPHRCWRTPSAAGGTPCCRQRRRAAAGPRRWCCRLPPSCCDGSRSLVSEGNGVPMAAPPLQAASALRALRQIPPLRAPLELLRSQAGRCAAFCVMGCYNGTLFCDCNFLQLRMSSRPPRSDMARRRPESKQRTHALWPALLVWHADVALVSLFAGCSRHGRCQTADTGGRLQPCCKAP